jgi:hypothetical protein
MRFFTLTGCTLLLTLALGTGACGGHAEETHGSAGADGSATQAPSASASVEALSVSCTVDADCGAAHRCVRSIPYFDQVLPGGGDAGPTGGGGFFHNEAAGLFCTTPRDKCEPTAAPSSSLTYCVFDATVKSWVVGGKQ